MNGSKHVDVVDGWTKIWTQFVICCKKSFFSRKIRSNKSCQKEVLERPKRQIGRKMMKLKLFILKR